MRIELLHFDGCPGYAELRERLPRLLERAGVDAEIEERRIDSEGTARRERFLGSPTLRIDGLDVVSSVADSDAYALRCRLYSSGGVLERTPPDEWIIKSLRAAANRQMPSDPMKRDHRRTPPR